MTGRPGRPRIRGVKAYARLLCERVDGHAVVDVAKEWGIPRWVLDDGISGKVNAPSAKYLPAVARGLGMTVEELLAKLSPQEVPAT